ncbi:hypothetical protein Sliba_31540 [Streptomyces nigrescens]|uniref:Cysteine-rich domain-containing protein n=1 Tax=Streptomyces nigrescens TaxID=1920 RepID=A0A640TJZ3_STRNI|nr:hypothetical protein Sliba_31540 [Streptomyces libani subsp. libani]GGW08092.1 hypothetical protein GCM10010500_78200 [Streptomyces libani subsp. libani]
MVAPSQGDGHQGSLRPFGDGYWGSLRPFGDGYWGSLRPFDDATGGTSARTVILWPDTFTNHLSPEVGRAAVHVLEAAGLRPLLPPTAPLRQPGGALPQSVLPRLHRPPLCCGLTYVSTGQLDRARRVMRRTVEVLSPLLQDGHPLVVLEPSCAAALRTDLPELLSDDPRAAQLARSVRTFVQALEELAPDWQGPTPARSTGIRPRNGNPRGRLLVPYSA